MQPPIQKPDPAREEFYQLPGRAGVWQTMFLMKWLARDAAGYLPFREWAQFLARGQRTAAARYNAVIDYANARTRFAFDPDEMEQVRDPVFAAWDIEQNGFAWGDCDDMATLLAAMLTANDLPNSLAAVAVPDLGEDIGLNHVVNALPLGGGDYKIIDISTKESYYSLEITDQMIFDVYP